MEKVVFIEHLFQLPETSHAGLQDKDKLHMREKIVALDEALMDPADKLYFIELLKKPDVGASYIAEVPHSSSIRPRAGPITELILEDHSILSVVGIRSVGLQQILPQRPQTDAAAAEIPASNKPERQVTEPPGTNQTTAVFLVSTAQSL